MLNKQTPDGIESVVTEPVFEKKSYVITCESELFKSNIANFLDRLESNLHSFSLLPDEDGFKLPFSDDLHNTLFERMLIDDCAKVTKELISNTTYEKDALTILNRNTKTIENVSKVKAVINHGVLTQYLNNSNQNLGAVFFNKLVNHLNNNPLIKGEFLSLCKEQKKNPVKVIEYVAEDCVAKFKQDPKQHHYCVEEDISLEHGEYLFDGIYTCKGCEVSQSLARTKGRSFY